MLLTRAPNLESRSVSISLKSSPHPQNINIRIVMSTINETVFQKPKAEDDRGLEEEAKSLLVRIPEVLRNCQPLTFVSAEWEVRHA